jgi:hypothetical protein
VPPESWFGEASAHCGAVQGKNDLYKLSARSDTSLHIASDTRVQNETGGYYVPPNAVSTVWWSGAERGTAIEKVANRDVWDFG